MFLGGRGEESIQVREKDYPTEAWVTLCNGVGDGHGHTGLKLYVLG